MPGKESLSARLDELAARFARLEERVNSDSCDTEYEQDSSDSQLQYCGNPEGPSREFGPEVSTERAEAILATGNKWVNGTELHYYFFDSGPFGGDETQQSVVRDAIDVWKEVGIGLTFSEVSLRSESEIRIGFQRGKGSWSRVGTGALGAGQNARTMNFGWNINVTGPNGRDTAVHELGHALGFHHEHQNPNAGIVWNREEVYEHFARTQDPPWDRGKTDFNILNKIDPRTVDGSDWDPDSIMHYAFARGLIRRPERFRNGLRPAPGLSDPDREVARRFYPDVGPGNVVPELRPWESERLSLEAGEQKDFNVLPTETRDYNFRTFGSSDTVMVLFEEDGGDFRFVEGDDDSGFDRNASFRVRLVRGRKYQLRIRLYFSFSTGDTAVMMW